MIKITQPPPFFSFLHFENLEKHKGPKILKNKTFLIQLNTKNERENVIGIHFSRQFILGDQTKFLRVLPQIKHSKDFLPIALPAYF